MKTAQFKISSVNRAWHLVDAQDQVLGRLASQVARTIQGKGKRLYTPNVDCGDYVVVINAEKIKIKGNNKPIQKIDFRHSGYPGGHTYTPYGKFLAEKPERAITLAVSGMLPKTRLRKGQLKRLRVVKGESIPNQAQFNAGKKKEKAEQKEQTKPTESAKEKQ